MLCRRLFNLLHPQNFIMMNHPFLMNRNGDSFSLVEFSFTCNEWYWWDNSIHERQLVSFRFKVYHNKHEHSQSNGGSFTYILMYILINTNNIYNIPVFLPVYLFSTFPNLLKKEKFCFCKLRHFVYCLITWRISAAAYLPRMNKALFLE